MLTIAFCTRTIRVKKELNKSLPSSNLLRQSFWFLLLTICGYRFSAFWLRSSVVSVLISLISDTCPTRAPYIKLIFGAGRWNRGLLRPLHASTRYCSTSGNGAPPKTVKKRICADVSKLKLRHYQPCRYCAPLDQSHYLEWCKWAKYP